MAQQTQNVQYVGIVRFIIKANETRNNMGAIVGIGAALGGVIALMLGWINGLKWMDLLGFMFNFQPYSFISLSIGLLIVTIAASLMNKELVITFLATVSMVFGGVVGILFSYILDFLGFICIPFPVAVIVFVLFFNIFFTEVKKVEEKK